MLVITYCTIPHLPPLLPLSHLNDEVRQANSLAAERSELQAQLEETRRRASYMERVLSERGAECRELASLRRELEELRTLSQSQEQRAAQCHREAQQSRAELASLEATLALLHLREVGVSRGKTHLLQLHSYCGYGSSVS